MKRLLKIFPGLRLFMMSILLFHSYPAVSHASSTDMPWESPLESILDSVSGPVVQILGIVAIIIFGLGLAFSESGGMLRKALWVLLGLSIAFSAVSWGVSFLGFSGGLLV